MNYKLKRKKQRLSEKNINLLVLGKSVHHFNRDPEHKKMGTGGEDVVRTLPSHQQACYWPAITREMCVILLAAGDDSKINHNKPDCYILPD